MTTATYSIPVTFAATSYAWSVPTGMTITAGAGTTSITVNIASTFIEGSVTIMAVNACGSIPGTSLVVYGKVPPIVINGSANVCGLTTATYSTNAVVNATSYIWGVPTGWSITAGSGTTSITVSLPANVNNVTYSGAVKVAAVSTCGTSAYKSLTVSYCKSDISMNNGTGVENGSSAIYPNPATSEFAIDITTDADKNILVEVYNILGAKIITEQHSLVTGTNTIKTNISSFDNGMYFVRMINLLDNNVETKTFVKQ